MHTVFELWVFLTSSWCDITKVYGINLHIVIQKDLFSNVELSIQRIVKYFHVVATLQLSS